MSAATVSDSRRAHYEIVADGWRPLLDHILGLRWDDEFLPALLFNSPMHANGRGRKEFESSSVLSSHILCLFILLIMEYEMLFRFLRHKYCPFFPLFHIK